MQFQIFEIIKIQSFLQPQYQYRIVLSVYSAEKNNYFKGGEAGLMNKGYGGLSPAETMFIYIHLSWKRHCFLAKKLENDILFFVKKLEKTLFQAKKAEKWHVRNSKNPEIIIEDHH